MCKGHARLTCEAVHRHPAGMVESFLAVALVLVQDEPVAADRQTLRRKGHVFDQSLLSLRDTHANQA